MGTRKSIANVLLEGPAHSTPVSSSPLRRKSIFIQKSGLPSRLSENDDEAERLARRREINSFSTPVSITNNNDRRRSLGLSFLVNMPSQQMSERISQCIKLGTENKINPKNAFSLEMIDFMTYMIKKQDANMSNLQVASTSLDVSTKIYGFRVDGVHMELLKMMGGLDKNNEIPGGNDTEPMDSQERNEVGQVQEQLKKKKKKKKNKQRIFTTVEAIRIKVETEKPSLITMEADLQTTDMLYQAMLPNHANSKFYLHPYNDILVDTVEHTETQDNDVGCGIPNIEDFSNMQICPPMFYFDFQSWNADEEPVEIEPERTNENRFQFDLDASLPHDNELLHTGMNYLDLEDNDKENVDRCAKVPNNVENIVDFRDVLTTTVPSKVSEYSFIQKSLNIHWAGPSHWKVTNFKKMLGNSKMVEMCRQGPGRKKKEIELCFDDKTVESVEGKFMHSRCTTLHAKTAKMEWNEEILTLPPDMHYDIMQGNKLYFQSITIKQSENTDEMDTTHLSDNIEYYNYENEHDTSRYRPETNDPTCDRSEGNCAIDNGTRSEEECVPPSQAYTGDNLVALPRLINKSTIPYCVRAKKIDMRQLKKVIWTCLTTDSEKDVNLHTDVEKNQQDASSKMNSNKKFTEIYKKLPNLLTKNTANSLSFPISFVSLLHLVNEKALKLTASPDMTDLIVEQD
ncbi:PREDICTED: condensin complex subunit 2-like [Dufourea novaeangliae]|uniref:Condensin complex subunit 2 n=1 Tax=Dufourea novaeangliae TaxID=178035 RepID=A0A154NYW4_DUFNO|nr:PREDICTED: condensin complex subunit 2-like [Dufourea novaeangliae]KZC04208.1 Condensin complex subunit 2 [Dufourea novaeangliae]